MIRNETSPAFTEDARDVRVLPAVELRQLLITAVLSANAQQRRERFAQVLAQPDPARHAVELLRSPRPEIVLGALSVLEARGEQPLVRAVITLASHADERVRAAAQRLCIRWMNEEAPESAASTARAALADGSPMVRGAAAEASEELSSPLPLEFLEQRLAVERDVAVFSTLIRLVRRHADEAVAPMLARLALREHAANTRPEILDVLVNDLVHHGHITALRFRRQARRVAPSFLTGLLSGWRPRAV